jgi:DNA-binding NarL/FixJ family response regulator
VVSVVNAADVGWLLDTRVPRRPLSPREQQVLGLIIAGRRQKEVAFELGISDATVRVLYSRAMRKLGREPRPKTAVAPVGH